MTLAGDSQLITPGQGAQDTGRTINVAGGEDLDRFQFSAVDAETGAEVDGVAIAGLSLLAIGMVAQACMPGAGNGSADGSALGSNNGSATGSAQSSTSSASSRQES